MVWGDGPDYPPTPPGRDPLGARPRIPRRRAQKKAAVRRAVLVRSAESQGTGCESRHGGRTKGTTPVSVRAVHLGRLRMPVVERGAACILEGREMGDPQLVRGENAIWHRPGQSPRFQSFSSAMFSAFLLALRGRAGARWPAYVAGRGAGGPAFPTAIFSTAPHRWGVLTTQRDRLILHCLKTILLCFGKAA